jgi:hypothetical protein
MHNIQPDNIIRYINSKGGTSLDRVIRVAGQSLIISVPTIGGTWVERAIPFSNVLSYTVNLSTSSI